MRGLILLFKVLISAVNLSVVFFYRASFLDIASTEIFFYMSSFSDLDFVLFNIFNSDWSTFSFLCSKSNFYNLFVNSFLVFS